MLAELRVRDLAVIADVAKRIGTGPRAVMDAEKGKASTGIVVYAGLLWLYDLLGPQLSAMGHRTVRVTGSDLGGVQVIDIESGACAEWFRIDGAIAEIYDVAVIPKVACPMSLGFASDEIKGLITHGELEAAVLEETEIGVTLPEKKFVT